jgi:hypothetical protein
MAGPKENIPNGKPSEEALERRGEQFRKLRQLQFTRNVSDQSLLTSLDMICEDRER